MHVHAVGQRLDVHDRKLYRLQGKSLVGNITATRKVKDYFDCSFLCMELGVSACLSFNIGKVSDNGYYTCELSNSERYIEPDRMGERLSYDYYGTTTEVRYKFSQVSFFSTSWQKGEMT